MPNREKVGTKFAVCIQSDDADLLTPRMIYQVLSDESAAKSKYVRVVDNEGEDPHSRHERCRPDGRSYACLSRV